MLACFVWPTPTRTIAPLPSSLPQRVETSRWSTCSARWVRTWTSECTMAQRLSWQREVHPCFSASVAPLQGCTARQVRSRHSAASAGDSSPMDCRLLRVRMRGSCLGTNGLSVHRGCAPEFLVGSIFLQLDRSKVYLLTDRPRPAGVLASQEHTAKPTNLATFSRGVQSATFLRLAHLVVSPLMNFSLPSADLREASRAELGHIAHLDASRPSCFQFCYVPER